MKIRNFKILALFFLFISFNTYGTTGNVADSLLYNIQDKIYEAFLSSFQKNNTQNLITIEQNLKKVSGQNQMVDYWIAYSKYYESIFYLKISEKKKSSKELTTAISILEKKKNKNSETYALLAFLQSFSIQFSGMSAPSLSSKVKKNAEMALNLEPNNIRAWYVLASNDYYTPKAFGGSKKCEEYLLKAISLNEQTIANPYMPSWGKSDSYALLIGYYIDKNDLKKAKEYLDTALLLYPDNYMLNQYVDSLKNNK
jgi:hypothetical protein